jgi:DNA-directed RNA polymerase II subunit RPB1
MSSYEFDIEYENYKYNEQVTGLQFGLMSPSMIRQMSSCKVEFPDTFDGDEPKTNGLFDPRMGVIDPGKECDTCNNNIYLCNGHAGHIDLALPIWNTNFINSLKDFIPKIFRCICYKCSNLLINKSDPIIMKKVMKKSRLTRFQTVYELSDKVKACENNDCCGYMQPTRYTRKKDDINSFHIIGTIKKGKHKTAPTEKILIKPEYGLKLLSRLSDEDIRILGFDPEFSRPEWLVMTAFPVAPPSIRPSVKQDNSQRREDDLTYALINVVKANKDLSDKLNEGQGDRSKEAFELEIEKRRGLLQYYIATYFDNQISGVEPQTQRSNRPLKTIMMRFKHKEGRMRGNLQGRRVDYSARTVISGDPELDIDEFGIPVHMAKTLTFPDIVSKYNIDEMYRLVRNGPFNYPGAKSIQKRVVNAEGQIIPVTINLKHTDLNKIELSYGDVVNRHLKNGDWGLFNRHPSLHRMSMMGHRVVVIPNNKTMRLNPCTCNPYNADFDKRAIPFGMDRLCQ